MQQSKNATHNSQTRPSVLWGRLVLCIALGFFIFLLPRPEGLGAEPWRVFAVFMGVVAGFVLRPLGMAPTVLLALLALAVPGTVDYKELIRNGYGHSTVWLVVAAFLIADAVEKTGLGRRLALLLMRLLGRTVMGLGYAIAASELILAPFIPSNTARGGGVISPIVIGLAESLGSKPGETSRLAGSYLVQVGGHANLVASAMFLTAMAGNTLIPSQVKGHLGIDFDYGAWVKGSIVPGLLSLALVPFVVRILEPPVVRDVSRVRARVGDELRALGPWKREEVSLVLLLLALLVLWTLGGHLEPYGLHLGTTTVALLGVVAVVVMRIRSWQEVASTWRAWDALIWVGGFVAIAEALKSSGLTFWFADRIEGSLSGWGTIGSVVLLAVVYFFSMYFFSQLTAHIAALAGAFFIVAAHVDSPPFLAAALIAYFSCLCGAMTPWSSGPVIVYFQHGYVSVGRWMRNGLCMAILHLAIWLTIGMAWWKWLGWW